MCVWERERKLEKDGEREGEMKRERDRGGEREKDGERERERWRGCGAMVFFKSRSLCRVFISWKCSPHILSFWQFLPRLLEPLLIDCEILQWHAWKVKALNRLFRCVGWSGLFKSESALRELNRLGRFSAMFYRGGNVWRPVRFFEHQVSSEKRSTLKGSKFFPFRVYPFSQEEVKQFWQSCLPW